MATALPVRQAMRTMKKSHLLSSLVLKLMASIFISFASASDASAGCGMWIPCCPDNTPVVGSSCSPCQMNKTCGKSNPQSPGASGGAGGNAGRCVRQTEAGSSNVWKYTNTCNRAVNATITRRCDASDAVHAGRSKSVTVAFGANETQNFNRRDRFGDFCSTLAGNTNSESVTSQSFR